MCEETTEEYYTRTVKDVEHAARHYLDRVECVKTTDVHGQAQQRANLTICLKWCEDWVYDATLKGWARDRRLVSSIKSSVGHAAVWLVGQ